MTLKKWGQDSILLRHLRSGESWWAQSSRCLPEVVGLLENSGVETSWGSPLQGKLGPTYTARRTPWIWVGRRKPKLWRFGSITGCLKKRPKGGASPSL